jgi:hypothetical protein
MIKTNKRYTVAVIAGLCLVSGVSRADILIAGFEGSLSGRTNDATITYSTEIGVTEGAMSAGVQAINDWYKSAFAINVSGAIIKNSKTKLLSVDITAPASSFVVVGGLMCLS